ncbi:hypothetical protein PpBr36_04928 [Pyricularia pennisetigena]|uniref:hypothetical protein n=1 Tax=Pyricularia pennisetigena TaxID=1578925 RepID=UPI0011527657|nr:hypothetical protein PpBr36_04928 [Pyricularia pennisetigena]TLS27249.1 hypothetical protein PpBr36_04928 [Pyricularia pennisetigena]
MYSTNRLLDPVTLVLGFISAPRLLGGCASICQHQNIGEALVTPNPIPFVRWGMAKRYDMLAESSKNTILRRSSSSQKTSAITAFSNSTMASSRPGVTESAACQLGNHQAIPYRDRVRPGRLLSGRLQLLA